MADALPGAAAPQHRAAPVSRTTRAACTPEATHPAAFGLRPFLRRLVLRQALAGRLIWHVALPLLNRIGGAQ